MKNVFKTIGIIAFAAIIGFTMTGCDNNSSTQEQTEYSTKYTWDDSGKSYELLITEGGNRKIVASGSYILNDGNTISTGTASGALTSLKLTDDSGNSITLSITTSSKSITVTVEAGNSTLGSTTISSGTGTMQEIAISSGSITQLEGTWKWIADNGNGWQTLTIRGNTVTFLNHYEEPTVSYGTLKISGNIARFIFDPEEAVHKFSISGNRLTLYTSTGGYIVFIKQ